jgi:hypothetical protein
MPTLADLQAATPKCSRNVLVAGRPTTRCGVPMRYLAPAANMWRCTAPLCALEISGGTIARRGAVDDAVRRADAA